MNERVLVTGADGFIGSHLTEALITAGYEVRALVHYNALGTWGWLEESPESVRRELDVVLGDVRDPHGMRSVMTGCDAVLHLAALIGIPFSYKSPDAYVETNIRGTLNVLQAARDLGVRRVVHTSTSEVYGTARSVPINEEHPQRGQSPYAATKIGADQIALSFHSAFDLPVTIVRPFNTYGPRQSARAVIPTVIAQIASGRDRIELGSIEPTRDFTYVADTVRGFMAALDSDSCLGEAVNLGSGFEISIGEVASIIAALMEVKIEILADPKRVRPMASEVERLVADARKASEAWNWQPHLVGRDGLCQGLQTTIEWFTDPTNLAFYKPDIYSL